MNYGWLRKLLRGELGQPPIDKTRFLTEEKLWALLELVGPAARPNINALRTIANKVDPMALSIKQYGYSLARQIGEALPPPGETKASSVGLQSSLSTQAAIESHWVAHWCSELKMAVMFHRKVWEHCFILQALYERGHLVAGARGLGFGCGIEPQPSYFASLGIDVLATDLEPERAAGWVNANQNTGGRDAAFHEHLVDRAAFEKHVSFRFADMNAIPEDLVGYDFCWSVCALEHLGSIAHGQNFIENAMRTLRPGGTAVHTTEFNIVADGPTVDNWDSVAFQRRHMLELADRLTAQGHHVVPFDFTPGDKPLDRFVDVPPWHHDLPEDMCEWLGQPLHLKLAYEGLILTCIGIIVHKRQ